MLSDKALQESPEQRLVEIAATRSRDDVVVVHEVYASVQGESTHAGRPCVFVRTTGCHLRCTYCDTEHAFHEGSARSIPSIVAEVAGFGVPLVELTGGEPLLQKGARSLVTALIDAHYEVLIETSGAVSVDGVDRRAKLIVDVKTPGSGESDKNIWKNLALLTPGHDEVKFVIVNDADYAWTQEILPRIPAGVTVLLSPSFPSMAPDKLAEAILRDRLPVRFQVQLHKILWGEKRGT
ncbi:MAG TPA: radical SAM protein [Myxococcota bacterium]|jgi:7-carboxy-7-deazaguanine synthase